MNKYMWLLIVSILLIVIFNGCSSSKEKITIGLVPSNNPQEMKQKFDPIRKYIQKEINVKVEVIVPDSYYGLIEGMKKNEIDIGWYGAFSYVIAEKQLGLEPLVIQYRKGYGTSYHSLIITRNDSGITDINDLRNKRFAFVDSGSTSGFMIPYSLFESREISFETYFSDIIYSGTHDDVALDVLSGKADAGAMEDLTLNRLINSGEIKKSDINIIWKSDDIPGSPFIARRNMDDKLKAKFKRAMLSIHEKSPQAVKSFDKRIQKYVEFDKSLYNEIRNITAILGEDYITEKYVERK